MADLYNVIAGRSIEGRATFDKINPVDGSLVAHVHEAGPDTVDAAVVFDDADLDKTIAGLARSVYLNTGQVCLCTERVYVQRGVFDEVAAGLVEAAGNLKLGRPTDEGGMHSFHFYIEPTNICIQL